VIRFTAQVTAGAYIWPARHEAGSGSSATWTRGRGWAIWKAMKVLIGALDDDLEDAAFTSRVIDKILADHRANT
jgi:aminoglycoside phosphotransferase (APT) family kinase protein